MSGIANDVSRARGRIILGTVIGLWLWFLWLGLSARPAFATVATLITSAVFVRISQEKYAHLREPLVFSDIGYVNLLLRHPTLFYLGRKEAVLIGTITAVLLAIIFIWPHYEPRAVGSVLQVAILILASLLAGLTAFRAEAIIPFIPGMVADVQGQSAYCFVRRLGLSVSLLVGYAAWRADQRWHEKAHHEAQAIDGTHYDAVIVVQSESFVDLRRQGSAIDLPNLDHMRRRSLAHGRLSVSCFGAYTHRSEVEMLSGISFSAQGMDRFDPYLRPERFANASLAARLRRGGWRTCFIHPHDPSFFRRDRAIPRIGFDFFIAEDEFALADRYGPYIGDLALADRISKEILSARRDGQPLFLMAVSMEAHDPYGIGRIPETDDPVEQYVRHIAHADALLGQVAAVLDSCTGKALLVFYGDHAPILPGHECLAEDTATDFVLLSCGSVAEKLDAESAPVTLSPAEVYALLCSQLERNGQSARNDLPPFDVTIESIS